MISVDEALARILAAVPPPTPQRTRLRRAAGRVLAAPVISGHDSPPFDTSAMDGFAVRAADLSTVPGTLPVQGEVIAGDGRPHELKPGHALRINTGAPLPLGADAVVRIEDVRLEGGARASFPGGVATGENIRRRGEDFSASSTLLKPGRRLHAADVGVLASLGLAHVSVGRMPRVALFSTGNELAEPGDPLPPGGIYNSSRHALVPLLAGFGAEIHDMGRIPDDVRMTRDALERGLAFDVMVTTGGVSMGTHDFVRPALSQLGVRELFWKVRQRPGKPLYFGVLEGPGQTLCFGLPGNPVSVFVTALVYVRAALLRFQGMGEVGLLWRRAVAAEPFPKKQGLTVYVRAEYATPSDGAPGLPALRPARGQGSHQFSALAGAAGLVRLAEDAETAQPGDHLDFLDLTDGL
jgi:molybdopterin molybdotransferase